MKEETRVFIGDFQYPFQDDRAVQAAINTMARIQPNAIHFVGDVLDFYQLSDYTRDPAKRTGLFEDISNLGTLLRYIRVNFPNARIEWEDGNHEDRLRRYLWKKAPELADFPSLRLEELLGFKELEVSWRPYNQGQLLANGNFLVTHGNVVRNASAYTAKANLDKYGVSGISGHTHRLGSHYKRNLGGLFAWFENGCLCKLEGMEYINHPNWQQGFSVGTFKGSRFHIDQVPIVKGEVMGPWKT